MTDVTNQFLEQLYAHILASVYVLWLMCFLKIYMLKTKTCPWVWTLENGLNWKFYTNFQFNLI